MKILTYASRHSLSHMAEMAPGLEPAGGPSEIGLHSEKDPQKINKRQTSLFNYVSTEGSVKAIQSSLTT